MAQQTTAEWQARRAQRIEIGHRATVLSPFRSTDGWTGQRVTVREICEGDRNALVEDSRGNQTWITIGRLSI